MIQAVVQSWLASAEPFLAMLVGLLGINVALLVTGSVITPMFALVPRRLGGIPRLITNMWVHWSWRHLIGNFTPFLVLSLVYLGSHTFAEYIKWLLIAGMGTSVLMWILGRTAYHAGLSSIIFAFFGLYLGAAIWSPSAATLGVALGLGFAYGSALFLGILTIDPAVSVEAHFFGLVVGLFLSKGI